MFHFAFFAPFPVIDFPLKMAAHTTIMLKVSSERYPKTRGILSPEKRPS